MRIDRWEDAFYTVIDLIAHDIFRAVRQICWFNDRIAVRKGKDESCMMLR